MRAQIGRSVSPSCGSPATYVQLRPISSDLEKCRAIMAIRMPYTQACRSAIADPVLQMSMSYPKLLRLRCKIYNEDTDQSDRYCDEETRAKH